MPEKENNYAFIDGQNLYQNTRNQGWRIDYVKLRIYLKEKYGVQKVFIFLGYIEENASLYKFLERNEYYIIFKEVSHSDDGKIKGNCDTEMVFTTCLHFWNFDKAVIISGDGDFYSIVEILNNMGKLRMVIAPDLKSFSSKFIRLGDDKLDHMNRIRHIVAIK